MDAEVRMLGNSLAKFSAPPLLNPRAASLSSFYLINQQHVTQLMIHPSRNIFSFWLFILFLFQLLLLRLLVTLPTPTCNVGAVLPLFIHSPLKVLLRAAALGIVYLLTTSRSTASAYTLSLNSRYAFQWVICK